MVYDTLPQVNYEASPQSKDLKDKLAKYLRNRLDFDFSSQHSKNDLDLIECEGRYGFAFAISKFDDKFRADMPNGIFRYKSDEVIQALREAIREFDLSDEIHFDRGFGVFVFNIFMKQSVS